MHDLTRLEVLQRLLCNFRTGTRLRLSNFVPRESTVVDPEVDVKDWPRVVGPVYF